MGVKKLTCISYAFLVQAMGVITSKMLVTMDADTTDNLLVYTITSEPEHGILESTLSPGTPITVFTQGKHNLRFE